jgi:hypothetical protein
LTVVDDLSGFAEPPIDTVSEELPEGVKICAKEGCEQTFTLGNTGFARNRIYCDEHRNPPKKKKDRAPKGTPQINLNVGGPKKQTGKDKDLEAVRTRAAWLVTTAAALTSMAGFPDDGLDLQRGAEPWAETVKDLAAHEEWLRKVMTGGEVSERVLAWAAFLVATGALALPILLRHGVIPAENPLLGQILGTIQATASEQPIDQAA